MSYVNRPVSATSTSYAPYSHVTVGACAITTDGRFVVGANVENASFRAHLVRRVFVGPDLARVGGGRLLAVSIVAGDGEPIAPCGRCRQLLFEHGGNDLLVDAGDDVEPTTLRDLLPGAFGPEDLDIRRSQ